MTLYAIALASGQASASVTTVTLFSLSNNRNISFQVYLPPNYNNTSTFRYPVVYDLHGIGGTSLGRSNQVVPTLDSAITSGSVQPMIWIFPDGQTNAFYGNAFDGHKQVYSNIIGEVLPYGDSHYRTLADRKFRAIEGFSMGGFGASMYAAKRSDLFSAVVEYGGALTTWNDLVHFNNAVAVEMYNSVEANFTPYSLWDQTDDNATALAHHTDYAMFRRRRRSADAEQYALPRSPSVAGDQSHVPGPPRHCPRWPRLLRPRQRPAFPGRSLRAAEHRWVYADGPLQGSA
jgi:S-formylglutathione hydrolase FrmB